MKTLSILIPTLPEREPYLRQLVHSLGFHLEDLPRLADERVEILIDPDPRASTGAKRNRLVQRAQGKYSLHVDDDDLLTPSYLSDVLLWLEYRDYDAIGYFVQFYEDGIEKEVGHYSRLNSEYRCQTDPDGKQMYLRPISHINPVKTSLAKQVKFPDTSICEDVSWTLEMRGLIRTEKFLPFIAYHYFYQNNKSAVPTDKELAEREQFTWSNEGVPQWAADDALRVMGETGWLLGEIGREEGERRAGTVAIRQPGERLGDGCQVSIVNIPPAARC